MRAFFALVTSVAALTACTTPEPPSPNIPSTPEATSPQSPSPAIETFELEIGEQRISLKPRVARPGDVVACDGRMIEVPEEGQHRGASGEVWVVTSTTGLVSMGCGTEVVWGQLTTPF
jgi:hypothetical protein